MPLLPPERKCDICGKTFLCPDEWAYRRKNRVFCSWGCLRKYTAFEPAEVTRNKKDTKPWTLDKAKRDELMQRAAEGEQTCVLMREYGISAQGVRYYKRKVKDLGLPGTR